MIRLHGFGPLRAVRVAPDGSEAEVDLGGPRQRAVLGVLAAAGPRVVSTDRLVEELYDGRPPPQAVAALQAFVSHLRRRLEPERPRRAPASVLVSVAPGYRLRLPTDAVDTWHFAELASAVLTASTPEGVVGLADEALALWVDDPWTGYAGTAWADQARDGLRRSRDSVGLARGQALLDLGRPEQVVQDLAGHLEAEPLDEQAVRLVALALYRAQRQAAALELLSRTRRGLAEELGVDPGPALRELERQVLHHDPALLGPVAPAASAPAAEALVVTADPAPPVDDGVVGRDAELGRLRDALAGRGVVWVEGEAGIGKSTLVDRVGDESVGGREVVRGRCSEVAGTPPAWPWVEVLAQLRPDVAPAAATPFEIARDLVAQLRDRVAGPPLLVALDDVHRADDETLQVLRQVVDQVVSAALDVVVVATYRPDEAGPGLLGTRSALGAATRDHLRLSGLPDAAASELLARHAGRTLPTRVRERLLARAGGNPLYLRELGLVLGSATAADEEEPPVAVRDLIARRLRRLAPLTETVLQHAAVLGRDVDVDDLVALLHRSGTCEEDDALDALDAAYVAGLLEQTGRDGLRFSHVLVRDTAYRAVPPLRRRRLHQQLVDLLQQRGASAEVVAFHAEAGLDARSASRALAPLRRAGEQLLADGSHREAARWLAAAVAAVALLDDDDPAQPSTPALHHALVRAWAGAGEWARARDARRSAVEAARLWGTSSDLARAWTTDAPALTTPRPSLEDNAVEVAGIRAALADVVDDTGLRVRLLVALVHELELAEPEAAVGPAREAERLARELDDPWLECLALDAAAFVVFADPAGGPATAEPAAARMLSLAEGAGLGGFRALAHFHLHAAAVGRGDLVAAAAHIDQAVRLGTVSQLGALLANARAFEGTRALVAGHPDRAAELYAAAVGDIAAEGQPNAELITLWSDACTRLAQGSLAPLLPRLRAAYDRAPAWMWHDLLACALLDADARDELAALPTPGAYPRNVTWLVTTCVQAYNAVRTGDLEAVGRLHADLLPWAGTLARTGNGALVLGPVDLTLAGCAAVLGDLDGARAHQASAAVLARRTGSPHWSAEAEADLAGRLRGA